jgi:hypothetical protein
VAERDPVRAVDDQTLSELAPHTADPGGAHGKGYSADTGPAPPVPDNDPVPLAHDTEVRGHVRRRDEEAVLPPTGRDEAKEPGERVLGAGG